MGSWYDTDSDDDESDFEEDSKLANRIRQGCSCICASRLVTVSSLSSIIT